MLGEEMRFKPIDEQVVALMGASSGIGRETAIRFAKRGAKVVVSARNEGALRSLVDQIRRAGGEALAVPADVAEFEQVKAVADRAAEEYGTLDTWVHLSGVGLYASFDRTEPEEFKRVMDVNLMGQVYGAMVALPHLKREGRGALIHISSVEAKRSAPFHSAYAASKHAIDGFLESLRVELKREGWSIGVTNVMPAAINTPFFSSSRSKIGVKPMGFPPVRSSPGAPAKRCFSPSASHRGLWTPSCCSRGLTRKRPTSRNPRMIPTTSSRLYMKTESKETLVTGRIREVFTIG
jgi:NAD(P)-dependent dehydrogenase (short-subunit alcohol dehydrogenase family)